MNRRQNEERSYEYEREYQNDRMQGRPSVTVIIEEHEMECLFDTGTIMNVVSWERFNELENTELKYTDDMLRCANDTTLESLCNAAVDVEK